MKSLLVPYAGRLLGPICLQLRVINLLIQMIWEVDTQTNEPWQPNWHNNVNPNKAGLFECSFSWGGGKFDLSPSYFKKNLSNININLYNC